MTTTGRRTIRRERKATSGTYAVRSAGKDKSGGEKWLVVSAEGRRVREVITAPGSAAAIGRITKTHADALKRLAKK